MKNRFLISLLLLFGLLAATAASADTSTRGCETNTMKAGTFCNWAEGKSWCTNNTNTCAVESTTPCPADPVGGTYAFSCNINNCVLSCNSGYTVCTGTCKLNVAVPSNCTTFNQCTEVCSACAQGYELSGGACIGATLKLGSDSVGVSNYIFQTTSPVLTIPSTGNVGIGTTTPLAKLEVVPTSGYSILAGNFKIGNVALPTADGDVTTKGYVDSVISSATSTFASLWGGTAGADIWSLNSGNVGIGTTTPRAKLNIYAGAGHGLKINGFGTGDFYGIDFTSSGLSGGTDFLLYAAPTMYIRADGYMSFPYLYASGYLRTATLYHTAAMTIYTNSGAITLGTASTTNIIMNPGGNVGIGTTTPLAKLSIVPASGYSILAGNYKIGDVALPTADGDAATKGYVDSVVSSATSSLTTLWDGTTGGNIWSLNSGNVGIGITAPTSKLHVYGTTEFTAILATPSSAYSPTLLFTNQTDSFLENINNGSFQLADINSNKYYSVSTTSVHTIYSPLNSPAMTISAGNVGIGETNPNYKLKVTMASGAVYIGNAFNYSPATLDLVVGSTSNSSRFLFGQSNSNFGGMVWNYNANAASAYLSVGNMNGQNTAGLNILQIGNVGIGTTTPLARLSVVPTSGYSILAGNYKIGNVALPTADGDAATKGYVDSVVSSATSSLTTLWDGTTGGNIWNINSGNVGIGTINPTEKLHIEGSGNYLGFLVNNTAVGGRRWKLWATATGAGVGAGKFILYDDSAGQVRLAVDDAGNVGIGTTAPNNLLSVYDLIDFNNNDQNTRLGYQAGKNVKSGAYMNTFVGYQAGFMAASSTAAAVSNTAVGYSSFYFNDTGVNNTALGSTALRANTSGRQNTAVGMSALTGNTSGGDNVAVGVGGLSSNTTGQYNTAVGAHALSSATSDNNTAVGLSALGGVTTGSGNVAIGMAAGEYIGGTTNDNQTPDISIYIGSFARAAANGSYNEIVLGANAIGNGDNSVTIGNTDIATTILRGSVGMGTTTPTARLSVVPASGYSILAGNYKIGNVALPTADADAATKGYVDAAMSTGYLPLTGGTMAGAINMGNNNITNLNSLTVNKITATTIDPLYTIKGINYSTFAPSIAGGVKEEYTGKIGIYQPISAKEYEAVIDFASVKKGSDLWLWRQVIDYDKSSVDVAITPYGRFAQVYYLIDGNKLVFRSDKAVEISYRLTAKRFDWRDWPTLSNDQTTRGLEIGY